MTKTETMPKQARFLIFRGGAIGDFILTLPAIQALRDRWPDAYIELVGYPHIANLALAAGLVDHVESLDRANTARLFTWQPTFSEEQAAHIRSFDLVISYLHDPDGVVRANLKAAGAKQVIYGSPRVEEGHAIDHLMKPLETLAIYGEKPSPRLNLHAEQGKEWLKARGFSRDVVAIHPGSGSPKKNWPVENFLTLAEQLRESGQSYLMIFGEADAEVAALIRQEIPQVVELSGCTLIELATVLSACRVFVGNDSGVTHIAAAVGLPTIALFGPSDADYWGPRGSHVRVIQAPGGDLGQIEVRDVWSLLGSLSSLSSSS
jgi:heptosyltransferase III